MDWQVPLVIAASVFIAFTVWRLRPAMPRRGKPSEAMKDARKRIAEAKTDQARAVALADAGDACAQSVGRTAGAVGYYIRAMRSDPRSVEIVDRAAAALERRPGALESLLWRRLANEPWEKEERAAAMAALRHLVAVYSGPSRKRIRARALEHALRALGEHVPVPPDSSVELPSETPAPAK